jgi:outer membrane protein assembly factor BamD (BamD/ComL family)
MSMQKKLIAPIVLATSALLLSGCAMLGGGGGRGGADTRYVARDVNTLYTAAKEKLDAGDLEEASRSAREAWDKTEQLTNRTVAEAFGEAQAKLLKVNKLLGVNKMAPSRKLKSLNCLWHKV